MPIINDVDWEISVCERRFDFFYNGIISKEEYEKIKKLSPKTYIWFREYDYCDLDEIHFFENITEEMRNKYKYSRYNIDLVCFLIENGYLEL